MNCRGRTCSVAWCTNTNEQSILFSISCNASRAKQWEKALVYKSNVDLAKRFVCVDHFEDRCFTSTLKDHLLSTAIPTRQVKVKEEIIIEDEASESQYSSNNIGTYSKESTNILNNLSTSSKGPTNVLSEIHANNEVGKINVYDHAKVVQREEALIQKRNEEIEKTLEEYLRKRHLVFKRLRELDDQNKEEAPVKKTNYRFPTNLSIQKAVRKCTTPQLVHDIRNTKSNSTCSASIESNKPKGNNVTVAINPKEHDSNLTSCCLIISTDEGNDLKGFMSDDSYSRQSASEVSDDSHSRQSASEIPISKTSENKVKSQVTKQKVEGHSSNSEKKRVKNHSSKTQNNRVENQSNKASSIRTENCILNTEKERVENHSTKISGIRTENFLLNTERERVGNYPSEASDSSKIESKDICLLEISDDYNNFADKVAERLKKLKNPFQRIKALMGIQQVLLEAEYSVVE